MVTLEGELSSTTTTLTATLQSFQSNVANERREHSEEKSRLENKVTNLEERLANSDLQIRTLYEELEKLKVERAEIHTQLNVKFENVVRLEREKAALENKLRLEEEEKRSFELSFRQAVAKLDEIKSRECGVHNEMEQLRQVETNVKEELYKKDAVLKEMADATKQMERENSELKKNYIAICTQRDKITGEFGHH